MQETTDICFTYERGKTGKGGKWLSVKFNISKNSKYKDPLLLEEFIEKQSFIDVESVVEEEIDYGSELANLLGDCACNNEFSKEQVKVIQDLVIHAVTSSDHLEICNYLIHKIHKMNCYNPDNRFDYLCSMIKNDIDKL